MNRNGYLPDTLAGLAGLAFAVLLLFAFASVDPQVRATDEELVTYWSDSGKQRDMALSMYFFLAASPCLLIFLAGLRARLAAAEGGVASLTNLFFGLGTCVVATIVVTALARGGLAHSVRFGEEPLPGVDTLRTFTTIPTLMVHLAVMPLTALTVAAGSVAMLRSGAFSRWLGWAGLTAAAVVLVFVAFLIGAWASPLLQLWIVAAGFELWRTRNTAPVPARESAVRAGALAS